MNCIRGNDLDKLTRDDLGAIADWLQGGAFTPKRKDPKPHQQEALKDLLDVFWPSVRDVAVAMLIFVAL